MYSWDWSNSALSPAERKYCTDYMLTYTPIYQKGVLAKGSDLYNKPSQM